MGLVLGLNKNKNDKRKYNTIKITHCDHELEFTVFWKDEHLRVKFDGSKDFIIRVKKDENGRADNISADT